MRTTRLMSTYTLIWTVTLVLSAGACVPDDGPDPQKLTASERSRLGALARDYVHKTVEADESLRIAEQIRNFDAEQARYFHDQLAALNGYVGTDRFVFDRLFEESLRQKKSFLDLNEADFQRVVEDIKRLPPPSTDAH